MQILNAMLRLCLPYTKCIHTDKDSDGVERANETRCKCTKTSAESRTLIFASHSIMLNFTLKYYVVYLLRASGIPKEKNAETETEMEMATKPTDMICIVEELCLRSMPFYYIKRTRLRIIMLIHFHIHNVGFCTQICGLLLRNFQLRNIIVIDLCKFRLN